MFRMEFHTKKQEVPLVVIGPYEVNKVTTYLAKSKAGVKESVGIYLDMAEEGKVQLEKIVITKEV